MPGLRPGATRWAIDVREQSAEEPAALVAPWAVDTTPEATPRLLIEQAWSATVVR